MRQFLLIALLLCLFGQSCNAAAPTKAAPTKKPTMAPTGIPVVNATIINGALTIQGVPNSATVPMTSSGIQAVIDGYFPKNNYKTTQANVARKVWLNGTSATLSYLTITGDFVADVPISLPSQFILVLKKATITASPPLFSSPANSALLATRGNSIINMKSATFSGVVSPGGPSEAVISCKNYPANANTPGIYPYPNVPSPAGTLSSTGPDGISAIGSNNVIIDGITVDSCGLTSGNFNFFNVKVAELTNSVSIGGGVRGIWVIIASNVAVSYNLVTTSVKFGIDLDASSGPWTLVHSNTFTNNGYQAVFIEQGTEYGIITNNILGPGNQNGVSFFNNIYPELVNDHIINSNKMFGNTGAGLNVGSISCTAITLPSAKVFCPVIVGFWPSTDSYIIGNSMWGNRKGGQGSNGNALGFYYSHNYDTQVNP